MPQSHTCNHALSGEELRHNTAITEENAIGWISRPMESLKWSKPFFPLDLLRYRRHGTHRHHCLSEISRFDCQEEVGLARPQTNTIMDEILIEFRSAAIVCLRGTRSRPTYFDDAKMDIVTSESRIKSGSDYTASA